MRELPEGWAACPLFKAVDVLDNLRIPVNSEERFARPGSIPYYGATGQVGWIDDKIFDEELVLLGEDGAPFFDKGKSVAYTICGPSWVNNHAHVLRARWALTRNGYIKHFLNSFDFHGWVNGTTRLKLTQASMNAIPVLLAPFPEQNRIVAKLDVLLTRVNACRQRLDKIPKLLARFRQSVLAAACSGRLTEDWRTDHAEDADSFLDYLEEQRIRFWQKRNTLRSRPRTYMPPSIEEDRSTDVPGSWRLIAVSHLAFLDVGFAFKSSDFQEQGVRLLRGENLEPGKLRWNDVRYWPEEKLSGFENLLVEEGEIILALDRPVISTGLKIARVKSSDLPCLLVQRMMRFKMIDRRLTSWLYINLLIPRFVRHLSAGLTGSDLPHVTGTGVGEYTLALPALAEAEEIVRRVDQLFAFADRLEARVEIARKRVEALTQSILAKAFRGGLVPTEAELARAEGRAYESAAQLLERIAGLNAKAADTPKRKLRRQQSTA